MQSTRSAAAAPLHGLFARLLLGGLIFMAAGFFMQPAGELLQGWVRILLSPGLLLTDFMAVGGIGAAFFNSGLMMALSVALCAAINAPPSGGVVAAVLSVGGFAFFGKTPLNALPLVAGTLLYARFQLQPLRDAAQTALFATAMGPLVSQAMLGMGLPWYAGVPLGIGLGLAAGFVLTPVGRSTIQLHQGHNLYNTGLAAGLITTALTSLLRLFGGQVPGAQTVGAGGGLPLVLFLAALSMLAAVLGWFLSGRDFAAWGRLVRAPGQLPSDFVGTYGSGAVLINLGVLGLIALLFPIAMGSPINGPVIGSMLMAIGFGAFGKHPGNALPVMAGALLASALGVYPLSGAGTLVVLMFSTTLAPITGGFGPLAGVAAGFMHVAVAHQLAGLQGGANLYNNGFAGGLVAAVLVPVFTALKGGAKPVPPR